MASKTQKLLVLDGNQRCALAATRSLGRIAELYIMTADTSTTSLAGSSRYSSIYYQSPCPQHAPGDFVDWLGALAESERIDYVFPMTEITSQLILMNREKLAHCAIPFASYEAVMRLADKGKLIQLASQLGILHPKTLHHDNANDFDDEPPFELPMVIKPNLSRIWAGAEWIDTAVQIVKTPEQLEDYENLNYAHVDYFRGFDKMYPESKFILNIRDVEKWIKSRNNH